MALPFLKVIDGNKRQRCFSTGSAEKTNATGTKSERITLTNFKDF